jgi:hypothetical protein
MGFLTAEIRYLKTGTKSKPNIIDLVEVFFHGDRIKYGERLRSYEDAGLTGEAAEYAAAEDILLGRPIVRAMYVAAWYWETFVVPTGYGDHAWNWIHEHEKHGPAIRSTEADIDRIGTKGDPQELQSVCDAWVDAWREAIEEWLKIPMSGFQASLASDI